MDGKRVACENDKSFFDVPILSNMAIHNGNDAYIKPSVNKVRYERGIIMVDGGETITFWKPSGQTTLESIMTLFEGYSK